MNLPQVDPNNLSLALPSLSNHLQYPLDTLLSRLTQSIQRRASDSAEVDGAANELIVMVASCSLVVRRCSDVPLIVLEDHARAKNDARAVLRVEREGISSALEESNKDRQARIANKLTLTICLAHSSPITSPPAPAPNHFLGPPTISTPLSPLAIPLRSATGANTSNAPLPFLSLPIIFPISLRLLSHSENGVGKEGGEVETKEVKATRKK